MNPLETTCRLVKEKLDQGSKFPLEGTQNKFASERTTNKFVLLDCRELSEYATAKIEGSILLPMSEMEARIGELTPHRDDEIVVHCHHGGRSLRVTQWLLRQGFTNVKSMAGGIDQWSQEIDPQVPRY